MILILLVGTSDVVYNILKWDKSLTSRPTTVTTLATPKPITKCMVSKRRIHIHFNGIWSLLDSAKHQRKDPQLTEAVIAAVKSEISKGLDWIIACSGEDPEGATKLNQEMGELNSKMNSLIYR